MSTSLPLCAIQWCEIGAEHELFFGGVSLADREGGKYADETATVLAEELLSGADEGTVIAVISAPSVFVQVRNILVSGSFPVFPLSVFFVYSAQQHGFLILRYHSRRN
jgi:hypothetical protein